MRTHVMEKIQEEFNLGEILMLAVRGMEALFDEMCKTDKILISMIEAPPEEPNKLD